MASGSFNTSTGNQYVQGTVTWGSTPNTGGNYSDVWVEWRFSRTNSGYETYGNGTFGIYVDGQQSVNTLRFSFTQNSRTLVVSGNFRVNHNSDGTKNLRIGVSGYTDVVAINEGVVYVDLDRIPRASSISSNISWTAAIEGLPLSISRASGSFTHSLTLQIKNNVNNNWVSVATRYNIGDYTTIYFDKNEMTIIYREMAQWENAEVWIKLDTFNGGTYIGSSEKYGRVYGATPATPVVSDFNIGTKSVDVTLDYFYDTFNYTLEFTFGSFKKVFPNMVKSNKMEFTDAEVIQMYQQVPNQQSAQANVYASTKYNGIELNDNVPKDQNKKITLRVVNSEPQYDGGFTYLDSNSATATLTGNNQYIIQSKSNLQVKLPVAKKAKPTNYSTITRYEVAVNGAVKSVNFSDTADLTVDFGTINVSTNTSVVVSAVDSRGLKKSVSSVILVLPYSLPTYSFSADRVNNFETTTKLNVTGSASPLNVSNVNKNRIVSAKYKTKPVGGAYGGESDLPLTGTFPAFISNNASVELNNTQAWEVSVTITDVLGSVTTISTVAVGTPILFIDTNKKSIGVNKFPTGTKTFEVAGDWVIDGVVNLKADQWWTTNGKAALDLKNSDIIGMNGLYFNDASDSGDEGLNFLKSGKPVGSKILADYDNFCVLDGNFKLNNRNLFKQEGGQTSSNIRLAGNLYSQTTGGAIFDVWGNIMGQPTATAGNTWSIKDADDRIRFLTGIGKGSTSSTEIYAYSGGIKLFHDGANSWNFWQSGGGAYCHFDIGGGRMKWNGDNATFEFLQTSGGWAKMSGTWVTPSAREYKKNIEKFEESALTLITTTGTYLYHYLDEDEYKVKKHLGLIVDESPMEIRGEDGKTIDTYAMETLLWKAVQELALKVDNIDRRITLR
ncbi:minor structural protein [Bacillus phage BigBertha]|uniref:Minor structural protein n=1 Tax=Bacillus phage BigBertha TaxID=1406781 RepID=U5PVJ7_9CAUD|nr:tail protein [Bacillus phage BigBertha]AGY46602.1 minor structural protein [Bacillus phage BigBertha]